MAKRGAKVDQLAEMLAFLEGHGGYYAPWHEVPGAVAGQTLNKAVNQHKVDITADGGLRLVSAAKSDEE